MPTLTSLRLFVVAAFAVCICAWLIATRKLQVYRTESKGRPETIQDLFINSLENRKITSHNYNG